MPADLLHPSPARAAARWLLAAAVLLALALWQHGPIAQWPDYHAFADRRAWLGIPNAADVLSNLPFAVVGAWGLVALARATEPAPALGPWRVFCAALVATAVGSVLYHRAPDNAALVVDRLPIAWACAALLCALLAERVALRWASATTLAATLVVATAAVLSWWIGEREGRGDLRAYLYVQFLPMLLVPLALLLRVGADRPGRTPDGAWWAVLGLYAAAKGAELADRAVFDALGVVSGHTLKHLLAAAAAWCIVRAAVRTHRPAPDRSAAAGLTAEAAAARRRRRGRV
jgi:hypothetical protein